MEPALWEIFSARARWENCQDWRPCVIVSLPAGGKVTIAPISASGLFNPMIHFRIPSEHENFRATGLDRASYVAGDELQEFLVAELGRKYGRMEGRLKKEFIDWIGE